VGEQLSGCTEPCGLGPWKGAGTQGLGRGRTEPGAGVALTIPVDGAGQANYSRT